MADFSIDQERLDELKEQVNLLSDNLDDDQRKVLNSMIRLAGDLADGEPAEPEPGEPRAFASDFARAFASVFTPERAKLIVQYADAAGERGPYPAKGATKAHGSGAAITAMITR
jgi:hypothetical protein